MRRRTLLGLVTLALVAVLLGAYAAYWRIVAGKVKAGVTTRAQTEQARKIDTIANP